MKKQKLVWYVAKTYINCKGEADVSVMCYQNNVYGTHWSGNLLDKNIVYFDTEEKAKKIAYGWANTDMTVHCRWIDIE